MTASRDPAAVAALCDHVRGRDPAAEPGYKEWFHFCVLGAGLTVVVNLSLADDLRPARAGRLVGRVTVLVRSSASGWHGDVATVDGAAEAARAGLVALDLGCGSFELAEGAYRVRARLARRGLGVDLRLVPVTFPIASQNAAFAAREPVRWLAVARLVASGSVTLGDRVHRIEAAPAYHDHNWGSFRWGGDFSWDWGFALPCEPTVPWALVFVHLMDRARTRSLSKGLFLWRGARPARVLRGAEVTVTTGPPARLRGTRAVPGVLGLLADGRASDVPATLTVRGRSVDDHVEVCFELDDLVRLVVPSDHAAAGVTVLHETSARAAVRGRLAHEPLELEARGVVEMVRA